VKTAQQAAQNWANSSGRAAQAYTDGVNNYSGDWAGRTTAQQAALVANFNQAVNSGAWSNGVNRRGTAGWKTATQAKVANYSTGYTAGAQRQAAAIAKIVAAESNIVGGLPPRGTYQQNQQRSIAMQDALHALKGQLAA
jgi:ATP-dependent Zn protease